MDSRLHPIPSNEPTSVRFGHTRVQWRQSAPGATDQGTSCTWNAKATEPDPRAGSCKTRSAA